MSAIIHSLPGLLTSLRPVINLLAEWRQEQKRYKAAIRDKWCSTEDCVFIQVNGNRMSIGTPYSRFQKLAVYNGVRRSGTGATVNHARKMGREIIVIDPITRLITHDETAPTLAQS